MVGVVGWLGLRPRCFGLVGAFLRWWVLGRF